MGGQQFYGGQPGSGQEGPAQGGSAGSQDNGKSKGKNGAVDADFEVVD
jgi:hypothetical protein